MFVLEHVVDRGDVAVVQAGDRARFPVQSLVGFGAGRFREGFERDPALQALVVREVDGAHGTGSERALDLVRAELHARRELH